jgi:hypothetical protein
MDTLDIAVYAIPGPTTKSGLALGYFPLDASGYLEDTKGNIDFLKAAGVIDVRFHLRTATVTWPDQPGLAYALSFPSGSGSSDALKIQSSGGSAPPNIFSAPIIEDDAPGAISAKNMVVHTQAMSRDAKTYFYSLTVAVAPPGGGAATTITVDPRIRNGGTTGQGGSALHYVEVAVVGFVAGIVLTWFWNRSRARNKV